MKSELKGLVVFCILMQNGKGIGSKAPSYVLEKFNAVKNNDEPEALLDNNNLAIFNDYIETWKIKETK